MSQTKKSYNLPAHPGITEEELFRSVELATTGSMANLFQWYLDTIAETTPAEMVWGAGNPDTAKFLIIGEAPGLIEAYSGVPFIGPAGVVLSSVLQAAGINRMRDCFIINSVGTTPDGVDGKIGKPTPEMLGGVELERVVGVYERLKDQLKAVVLLGKYAYAQQVAPDQCESIMISRNLGWYERGLGNNLIDVPVMVAYHPAFLLYLKSSSPGDPKVRKIQQEFLTSFREAAALLKVEE